MSNLFIFILILATASTALVAGLFFTLSVIIMPGIGRLEDREFIRSFQVIDEVIQDGQPLFALVWVGSIVSLSLVAILGLWEIDGILKWLLPVANLLYMAGVQLPTFAVNLPRNVKLQSVDTQKVSEAELYRVREYFELTWNQSNNLRTFFSINVWIILILILLFHS